MSKNKYERNKRINDCKKVMTIKNLSSKKFKVSIEVIEGEPLTSGDFAITIHSGDWDLELKAPINLLSTSEHELKVIDSDSFRNWGTRFDTEKDFPSAIDSGDFTHE